MKNNEIVSYELVEWFQNYKRDMPWRMSKDPYKIWLSEIILQQTQVIQGTPYYLKFIECFPTVHHLARASEEEVLRLWQGLGYYSRARNLLHTAQFVHTHLKGVFPDSYKGLLELKGIGEYTAAAIASISYNESVAVVDGNVNRVISRLFQIGALQNEGKTIIKKLAIELLNKSKPADHNQAMMELGSLICKPKNPKCTICPISVHCMAYRDNLIQNFPPKLIKKTQRVRYFNFIVPLMNTGKVFLTKRTDNDIWKNMHTFPLIESNEELEHNALFIEVGKVFGNFEVLNITTFKHILSHQILKATFYMIKLETHSKIQILNEPLNTSPLFALNPTSLNFVGATFKKNNIFEVEIKRLREQYSLPRIITKYMENKEISAFLSSLCL